jgi:hypothetical protein
MVDVEGYSTSDGLRYAMAWVKNVENLDWVEWRNLSSDEFAQKFEEYKNHYRMEDVESYHHNGQQYYAGIWVENRNSRGWAEYRDMTEQGYRNRWYRMRDLGYRLIDFEIYPTAEGERYAGIWRQNSDRPDWALRDEVDTLVQNHLDSFAVPGIGVAIAQGGEIKYMRGFGFQDVDDNVWYSARTLNRLASVGKTVAAVLGLHLVEQGDPSSPASPPTTHTPCANCWPIAPASATIPTMMCRSNNMTPPWPHRRPSGTQTAIQASQERSLSMGQAPAASIAHTPIQFLALHWKAPQARPLAILLRMN